MGRTGFTLLGIDKASVGEVHPETVITLGKSKGSIFGIVSKQFRKYTPGERGGEGNIVI